MEIQITEEGGSPTEAMAVAPHQESYFFEAIQPPLSKDKDFAQSLLKWGLNETMVMASFRFNQKFEFADSQRFLVDLFNNPNLRYLVNLGFPAGNISDVKFDNLRATETTLDLFDRFRESKIITGADYIQKMFPKELEGIEIPDLLREALISEESDNYCLFSEKERAELLFKLFQLLVVGGSMNQYEDLITPYLEATKKLYKSLVTVRKDAQTGDIFVESNAFHIRSIDKVYERGYNPQEIVYVVVNPTSRTAHVITNKWVKFW